VNGYTSRLLFCFSVSTAYLSCRGCEKGIASNKLLAKIASAKNKPDRQTVVGPCCGIPFYLFSYGSLETTEFYLIDLHSLKAGYTYEDSVLICVIFLADYGALECRFPRGPFQA
jgi:hypothetical protein